MAQDPNKPQGGGDAAPGQQQMHTITKTDPATGATQSQQVTQDQWKNGPYKDEGWQRSDDPASRKRSPAGRRVRRTSQPAAPVFSRHSSRIPLCKRK
jgi:hypothetical protein